MVLKISGAPPPSTAPRFADKANLSLCMLQGVTSLPVLAIPIVGLRKSSSVNPAARSIARLGARFAPSLITLLTDSQILMSLHLCFQIMLDFKPCMPIFQPFQFIPGKVQVRCLMARVQLIQVLRSDQRAGRKRLIQYISERDLDSRSMLIFGHLLRPAKPLPVFVAEEDAHQVWIGAIVRSESAGKKSACLGRPRQERHLLFFMPAAVGGICGNTSGPKGLLGFCQT